MSNLHLFSETVKGKKKMTRYKVILDNATIVSLFTFSKKER
jgi:hypothetical protein